MTRYLILAMMFLSACAENNKRSQTDGSTEMVAESDNDPADEPLKAIQSNFFEIAKLDYHGDWLQRIFVVIPPERANDTAFLRQTILTLKKSYPIDRKSCISFFSDKKYADYKTALFVEGKNTLPMSVYEDWMNNYYLGEYVFETNLYRVFPVSSKPGKQKSYKINGSL